MKSLNKIGKEFSDVSEYIINVLESKGSRDPIKDAKKNLL
jgi:hypothetical protein